MVPAVWLALILDQNQPLPVFRENYNREIVAKPCKGIQCKKKEIPRIYRLFEIKETKLPPGPREKKMPITNAVRSTLVWIGTRRRSIPQNHIQDPEYGDAGMVFYWSQSWYTLYWDRCRCTEADEKYNVEDVPILSNEFKKTGWELWFGNWLQGCENPLKRKPDQWDYQQTEAIPTTEALI